MLTLANASLTPYKITTYLAGIEVWVLKHWRLAVRSDNGESDLTDSGNSHKGRS